MTLEPCAPLEENEGSRDLDKEAEDASAIRQVTHRDDSTATAAELGAGPNDLRPPFSEIVNDETTREPLPGQSPSFARAIDLTSGESFDDPDTAVRPLEALRSLGASPGDTTLRFDLFKITLPWTRDVDKFRPSSDPVLGVARYM